MTESQIFLWAMPHQNHIAPAIDTTRYMGQLPIASKNSVKTLVEIYAPSGNVFFVRIFEIDRSQ